MTPADSLRFVEDLYRYGVVKVTAIEIEIEDEMEGTSTLLITLPDNEHSRRHIFQFLHSHDFDGEVDTGQRFQLLHW